MTVKELRAVLEKAEDGDAVRLVRKAEGKSQATYTEITLAAYMVMPKGDGTDAGVYFVADDEWGAK